MKYVIQEQMVVEDVGSGQISWDRNCPKILCQIFPIVAHSSLQVSKEKIPAHFSSTFFLVLCENRKKGEFFLERNLFCYF